jgi:hypothetical protein
VHRTFAKQLLAAKKSVLPQLQACSIAEERLRVYPMFVSPGLGTMMRSKIL